MSNCLLLEVSDSVATVTLNRPEAMNALNTALKESLRDALQELADDETVRAVVLTGNGRAFCVGQDLAEHARNLEGDPGSVWSTVGEHYLPIATALATMPKPVVAAVNGTAAGAGAAFAFACDFRIVAATATFSMAFAAVGLAADSGMSWSLPRLVGMAKAKELLMQPGSVSADRALEVGLATEVVDPAEVAETAHQYAVRLASGPTVAYGAIRRELAFSAGHDLVESLDHERRMMELTGGTADHRRAVTAFLHKEKTRFEGR